MAGEAILPEQQFIRAVFAGELSQRCLAALFSPDADKFLEELRRQIDAALETLSYRERGIVEMRYALGDGYAYTLAEAGHVFQLTRERIRQLQARSLKKLRIRAGNLRDFLKNLDA